MADPAAHGEADADLELALKLHRELNAVPRRQRAPPRTQAASAALKTLSQKHLQQSESSSSSESETERQPGSGDKRRKGGGGAPSDNDSGSKRRRLDKGGGDKGSGRGKARSVGRRPQHVAAADEARRKAARAGGDGQPRAHVKCFYAGLQHGAWLAADALADRARLAAAVSRAFADDGVACSSEAATIVFVGADQQSAEFPGGAAAGGAGGEAGSGGGGGAADGKWEAAAKAAVRVYVR